MIVLVELIPIWLHLFKDCEESGLRDHSAGRGQPFFSATCGLTLSAPRDGGRRRGCSS